MKDKEKRSKKKINELEVQILEWKERCKYLQQKNGELTDKIGSVESDFLQIQKDTEQAKLNQAYSADQLYRKEEGQDRAFTDIKDMIS